MAVAKGTTIPKARLLDAVDATARAAAIFDQWAGIMSPEVPPDAVDAMQVVLTRWQERNFGHVPKTDAILALGVIEELGEGFDEDATAEECVDALGDVMVYASQLCTANRLAIRPVIELASLYLKANLCYQQAVCISGNLAHVVGKHEQRTRGLDKAEAYRPRLVDGLALMIAKAIEDCTVGHELTVDPAGVFLVIGREVSDRKAGDEMIPKVPVAPFEKGHVHNKGRSWSPTQNEACDIPDPVNGGFMESDERLRARLKITHGDRKDEALAALHDGIDSLGPGAVADPEQPERDPASLR